ncbi:MAG: polyphosphate kinase 2 family protein [Acidimicrobiales bacterium]|nr:polyphosphate kinase 2 family protein [Acidimicrobiales bacterium]
MTAHRVEPDSTVDLSKIDTRATPDFDGDKEDSYPVLDERRRRLAELQDVLYAQNRHRVLFVLQAMDTGGKDGTIRHVFRDVDPIGVRMHNFKKPSERELAHDYLWRVHPHVPGDGELVVFNRSHYEDVLVVRVHDWIDDDLAEKRFRHIREFERMLVDEGTTIVKVFLHISKDEQAERLRARLDEPDKNWKFSTGDLEERKFWDDYQRVYEDAISETSTKDAPWYVVPADRKWYRNLAVSQILIDTMEGLDLRYPEPEEGLDDVVVE